MVIPMFPQYSESTIASGVDALAKELSKRVKIPTFEVITTTAPMPSSTTRSLRWMPRPRSSRIRESRSTSWSFPFTAEKKGDDYYRHCYETFRLIIDRLRHLKPEQAVMTFQSRFGSEEWITPYTEDTVEKLIEEGNRELMVYSPSFVADCRRRPMSSDTSWLRMPRSGGASIRSSASTSTTSGARISPTRYDAGGGSAQDKEDIEYQLRPEDYEPCRICR